MKHRWNKGKKNANVLPNGDKIIHLKVGGRTSAVVPNVQKKTGPVAGDVPSQDDESDGDEGAEDVKPKAKAGKKAAANGTKKEVSTPVKRGRKQATKSYKEEEESDADEGAEEEFAEAKASSKKRKSIGAAKDEGAEKTPKKAKTIKSEVKDESGRRRSGRGVEK
jgi:formamidopyrimidine-DNA glycosylase